MTSACVLVTALHGNDQASRVRETWNMVGEEDFPWWSCTKSGRGPVLICTSRRRVVAGHAADSKLITGPSCLTKFFGCLWGEWHLPDNTFTGKLLQIHTKWSTDTTLLKANWFMGPSQGRMWVAQSAYLSNKEMGQRQWKYLSRDGKYRNRS